jgi:putative hydrolase of the HAD superfamily
MINCVVFDYGGVISHAQDKKSVKKICSILKITEEQLMSVYQKERFNYDAAKINASQYWNIINGYYNNTALSEKDLSKIIYYDVLSWSKFNKKTIKTIKALKRNNIKLAILSNMNFEFLDYLNKKETWFKHFDNRIFSCEINKIKPDKEIYRFILQRISEFPENVLFIDDSESNILAAKKLGINTIHFNNTHEMIKAIKKKYNINI